MKNSIALIIFILTGISSNLAQNEAVIEKPRSVDTPVYDNSETVPEFPGGMTEMYKFLGEKIIYPKEAIKNKVSGKVYAEITIGTDGSIIDTKIVKGVHRLLDEEALRVINLMPNWTPGKKDGEAVTVRFTTRINFKL